MYHMNSVSFNKDGFDFFLERFHDPGGHYQNRCSVALILKFLAGAVGKQFESFEREKGSQSMHDKSNEVILSLQVIGHKCEEGNE